MSALATKGRSLEAIATELNREVQLSESSYDTAVDHARRAGELLAEAKARVPHGGWLTWLAANTTLAERTAQAYMQLARSKPQRVADMPLRLALQEIAEPRQPSPDAERQDPPAGDTGERLRGLGFDTTRARETLTRPEQDRFPQPGVQRKAWSDIGQALETTGRHMRQGSQPGLAGWARGESFANAAASARDAAETLDELAHALR